MNLVVERKFKENKDKHGRTILVVTNCFLSSVGLTTDSTLQVLNATFPPRQDRELYLLQTNNLQNNTKRSSSPPRMLDTYLLIPPPFPYGVGNKCEYLKITPSRCPPSRTTHFSNRRRQACTTRCNMSIGIVAEQGRRVSELRIGCEVGPFADYSDYNSDEKDCVT
ncbi:hypothetical protein C0J52_15817 [Blattella germanica]|nr:hypothetical protein C0J52_15817 [Blattella germanica]